MNNNVKSNKSGKAWVVIVVVLLIVVALVAGIIYFVYNKLIKSGEIMDGTYSSGKTSFTVNVGDGDYTLTVDGKKETGKISDVTFEVKESVDDSKITYTAYFDGDGDYKVTMVLNPDNDPMQIILSSDKFGDTEYTLTEQKSK